MKTSFTKRLLKKNKKLNPHKRRSLEQQSTKKLWHLVENLKIIHHLILVFNQIMKKKSRLLQIKIGLI